MVILQNLEKVNELILNQALENFIINTYDKSLDIKDFDLSFVRGLSLEDGCSTLTDFTAFLISEGIKILIKKRFIKYFLICGGGRKNNFLMKLIQEIYQIPILKKKKKLMIWI